MPRRRGKTNQQWMDRIKKYRDDRDTMMERTRAAVCYLNTGRLGGDSPSALYAFMDIFHPEVPEETVRQMVRDKRADNERKRY